MILITEENRPRSRSPFVGPSFGLYFGGLVETS